MSVRQILVKLCMLMSCHLLPAADEYVGLARPYPEVYVEYDTGSNEELEKVAALHMLSFPGSIAAPLYLSGTGLLSNESSV